MRKISLTIAKKNIISFQLLAIGKNRIACHFKIEGGIKSINRDKFDGRFFYQRIKICN